MKANTRVLTTLLVLVLILSACGGNAPAPTKAPVATQQQAAVPTKSQPTATVLSSSAPAQAQAKANTNANLRGGPGTNFAIVGQVTAGQPLDVVARNQAGDWFKLRSGPWIFGELVDGAPTVPVDAGTPQPPAAHGA